LEILDNDIFDIFYLNMYNMKDLDNNMRKHIIQTLYVGLKNLINYIDARTMVTYAQYNPISNDES
jgi:hypothetical protein